MIPAKSIRWSDPFPPGIQEANPSQEPGFPLPWEWCLRTPHSVGSSGGIFREPCASARTAPDSLGDLASLTLLRQRFCRGYSNTSEIIEASILASYLRDNLL